MLLYRKEVLAVFIFHNVNKQGLVTAAVGSTTTKILNVWEKANIPTSEPSYVKKKVMKLFSDFKTIKKLKNRATETEVAKRGILMNSLEDIFDVAHADALISRIPEEDKEFLRSQREGRVSSSRFGVDQTLVKK